jgi:PII-like signaling protein
MHGFKGERTLMRIHIGERDKFHGKPLYRAIVELLRARHYAGATAFRGIMGFGASSKLHTDRVEILSLDLPIVIECVETEERIEAILPELDDMLGGGLITLERAKVVMYRHDLRRTPPGGSIPPGGQERRGEEPHHDWRTDITGRWQPEDPPQAP